MDLTKQLGRYVVVMLLQVLLFNQLQLFGVCHPYIYVMCLLMMPITLPHSVDMVIGAVIGLVMDVFCNSLGIHMAGCILIMFLRPYVLGTIINDKERLNEQINQHTIGMEAMIKYVAILVPIHHLTVFALGAWSWAHIGFVMLETVVSSLITIAIIIGYNSLRYR
jgi:rod shape-determining protein MreD